MAKYYLYRHGQTHGPYLLQQMHEFISQGEIGPKELVCEEGGAEWIRASQFTLGTTTQLRPGRPSAKAHADGARARTVTDTEVIKARHRLMAPIMGMLASIALPIILWVAKPTINLGLVASAKIPGIPRVSEMEFDMLPVAIGILGAIACTLWLTKRLREWMALRADR